MIGITLLKNKENHKTTFRVFDQNEIHIKAFVHCIHRKLMSGHSSSSTFHDSQELIISNHQNFRFSNLQISNFQKNKKLGTKY